jgi:hypothetical protein
VVAGDAAYNDVHVFLAESNADMRKEWISALDTMESLKPALLSLFTKGPAARISPSLFRRRNSTSRTLTGSLLTREPRKISIARCSPSILIE